MFDQLKNLKKIKDLQDSLKQEKETVEKEGIRVIVNGKMEIEEIKLNEALSKTDQERILKECINQAQKKIQMVAVQKMRQMGGL